MGRVTCEPLPGRRKGRTISRRRLWTSSSNCCCARSLLQNFGSMFLHLLVWLFVLFVCFGVWPLVGRWFVLVGFWLVLVFLSCVHAIIMFSLLHNGQNCCRIFGQNCCRIFGRYGRCRCFEVHVEGLTGAVVGNWQECRFVVQPGRGVDVASMFCWGLVRERWKLPG